METFIQIVLMQHIINKYETLTISSPLIFSVLAANPQTSYINVYPVDLEIFDFFHVLH